MFQKNWYGPKGWKLRLKKGEWSKSENFGKRNKFCYVSFFNWFNFALMVCGQFPLRSGLKIDFVLFEAEKVTTRQGFEIPPALLSRSASKRTNSNFKPFLGGNWLQTIKAKLNQLKNWYNKIFSVFQNSHSFTTHLFSASIFTPLGHTNFFLTNLEIKLIFQGIKWYNFRRWCPKLNQIIIPDRGELFDILVYKQAR